MVTPYDDTRINFKSSINHAFLQLHLTSVLFMADPDFQESDTVFSDDIKTLYKEIVTTRISHATTSKTNHIDRSKKIKKKKSVSSAIPVNNPAGNLYRCVDLQDEVDDDVGEDDEEEMIPPHVIIERRVQRKMAFSVCSGNGRTLKGRDLSQVRNSILRLTGFLET
ncbi:uncharacterized protein LOC110819714 [Carica papaya]|uniref:uncharacterized protein LOC110819714 n=1 Tax=Carica papaya TaxID=3649 RepID=UPI000B8CB3D7|nr:uncharacterized protein LOC110819714 [Carica papaya]